MENFLSGIAEAAGSLSAYERIHQASTVFHREVVEFIRDRDLHGRDVGWIDIRLLASAFVG